MSQTTTITVATYWGIKCRVLEKYSTYSKVEFHTLPPLTTELFVRTDYVDNHLLKNHEEIEVPMDEWTNEPIYDLRLI